MTCRSRLFTALFLISAPLARADEAPPAALVRFATIDDLLDQVEYVAKLVGHEEEAKQMVGFFKAARGAKGLDGVDTKRPTAFFAAKPEGLSVPFYLMIPVADEKTFVEDGLGKRLRLELKKESDTVRYLELPGIPVKVYVKFKNGYAYVTALEPGFLDDKKLPDPKRLENDRSSLVDLSIRLDAIPEQLKLFVLGQTETALAFLKQNVPPNEPKSLKALRVQFIDTLSGALKSFLMETKEITFKLKIDTKAEELGAEWNLIPVEGSKLAKDLISLKAPKSIFGVSSKDAVFRVTEYISLPSSLRKVLNEVIDEGFGEAMKNVPAEYTELAKSLREAVEPTLKRGEWDAGVAVYADKNGHFSVLQGYRLEKGAALDAVFRNVAKSLPEGLNNFIRLDASTGGKTGIHQMDVSQLINVDLQKVFDKDAHIWLAMADDRGLMYFGPDGKERLKAALETPETTTKLVDVTLSVGRMAPYFDMEKFEAMRAVAETIFGKDYKNDTVTMSLEGGESLRWRLRVPGKVLSFVGALRGAE